MQDNVGTIVIGTKVNNKGLEKGLNNTRQLVYKADKEMSGKIASSINTSKTNKVLDETIDKIEDLKAKIEFLSKQRGLSEFQTKNLEKYKKELSEVTRQLEEYQNANAAKIDFSEGKVEKKGYYAGGGEMKWYETELVSLNEINRKENELTEQRAKQIGNIQQTNNELQKQLQKEQEIKKINSETSEKPVEYDFDFIKDYSSQLDLLETKINEATIVYNEIIKEHGEESMEAQEAAANVEKLVNQYQRLQEQQNKIVGSPLKKLSDGFEGLIKKATRLALAVIGIRTIMNLITRSFNILSEYNTEIGNKMENLRLVLAVALEPIIMRIVGWLQTIMAYINYLTNAWFGLDLYARASELTTKKMAEDMESSAGSAKEMRKQLAGFDEMNVLGDNVKGGGGGAGKIKTPEFNLDPNVEIPEWLKWIKDNGPTIATIIGAIGAALLAIKLAPFIASVVGATESLASFSAGLALIAGGIVLLIGNIANLVFNWDEMDNKQKALSIGLAALGAAMIALGVAMAAGFSTATLGIGAVVAAVIGLIGWIGAAIIKNQEEAKSIEDTTIKQREYEQAKKDSQKALNDYVRKVDNAEEAEKELRQAMEEAGITNDELNDIVARGTKNYDSLNDVEKKVFRAYLNNNTAQEELAESAKTLNEKTLDSALKAALADKNYAEYGKTLKKGMKDGIINSAEMSKRLVDDMKSLDEENRLALVENLPKYIKDAFDWNKYWWQFLNFQRTWDAYIDDLKRDVELKIRAEVSYEKKYGKGNAKGAIMFASGGILNIPKLATGAVINRPGSGIPVANAIAGEAGREGILPLTDYRAMEMLGREIGKWISINATIPVTVGNRQIARVMQELGQQSAFAKND